MRWRMNQDERFWQLSYLKLSTLDRYHGQPTGMFAAYEHLAGRHPSRGTELCSIVEMMHSLAVLHQVQADVSFLDRLERVALNALPAALTAEMWSHNYLSTINEVTASRSPERIFGDNENATIYGLADRYTGVTPCCTANHNQGWPKLATAAIFTTPSPENAIAVGLLLPFNATMPERVGGGAFVAVLTDYPFGDEVLVSVTARASVLLKLRIPAWASDATVAVNSGRPRPVPPSRYFTHRCGVGVTIVTLSLNPVIRVEFDWGASDDGEAVNAVVVVRGPLVFSLPLEETVNELHPPWACFERGCSRDVSITSESPWNYALVLPRDDPPALMTFARHGKPSRVPFEGGSSPPLRIRALARRVPSWSTDPMFPQAAAVPPRSPLACGSGGRGVVECGEAEPITLVPFGTTRLRVGMLPWVED